ncbi:PilZ domain-containing protein [Sphingomonas sp. RB3P16]|uniref:PilZ domain-containing protein n=1 Tax=Parasphingomonas frigoris TaxID=3096163 RepID=UPI002FC846D0
MEQFSQDPFDSESEDGQHNRQDSRDSLFLTADFRLEGQRAVRPLRVRNLSSGGLMAECPEDLPQGVRVEFDVRGVGWVPGQVAWCTAGRIGVAFDRQIDPMLARKPVGQGKQTPVFVKPIFPREQR